MLIHRPELTDQSLSAFPVGFLEYHACTDFAAMLQITICAAICHTSALMSRNKVHAHILCDIGLAALAFLWLPDTYNTSRSLPNSGTNI